MILNKIAVLLLKLYQLTLGPFTQGHCRFYPTCSNYSIECFRKHSIIKAFFLTIKRLLKCCAIHPGGHDPCP
jgi:putative membrane protein insertion efficiency factor